MRTRQAMPDAIRAMCKYDLTHYRDAQRTVRAYKEQDIADGYGKRCQRVVDCVDRVMESTDWRTQDLLDLVYLKRQLSVEAAADILEIGKTSAYAMLNNVLIDYAVSMGYVKERGQ